MLARLRSIFNEYRDLLGSENIEAHPALGPLFSEVATIVLETTGGITPQQVPCDSPKAPTMVSSEHGS